MSEADCARETRTPTMEECLVEAHEEYARAWLAEHPLPTQPSAPAVRLAGMSEPWSSADDAEAAMAGYGPTEPFFIARAFIGMLAGEETAPEDLATLVTPESRAAWGDFSAAAAGLRSIPHWGLGSFPEPAPNAPDVAYVKVLRDEPESRQQEGDVVVLPAAWVTLIWRPEREMWLVHAFGDPLPADVLPRTSPGEAPDYTRA